MSVSEFCLFVCIHVPLSQPKSFCVSFCHLSVSLPPCLPFVLPPPPPSPHLPLQMGSIHVGHGSYNHTQFQAYITSHHWVPVATQKKSTFPMVWIHNHRKGIWLTLFGSYAPPWINMYRISKYGSKLRVTHVPRNQCATISSHHSIIKLGWGEHPSPKERMMVTNKEKERVKCRERHNH